MVFGEKRGEGDMNVGFGGKWLGLTIDNILIFKKHRNLLSVIHYRESWMVGNHRNILKISGDGFGRTLNLFRYVLEKHNVSAYSMYRFFDIMDKRYRHRLSGS